MGKVHVRRGKLSQHVKFQADSTPRGQTGEVLLREGKTGLKIVVVLTGRAVGHGHQRAPCTCSRLSVCLLATEQACRDCGPQVGVTWDS